MAGNEDRRDERDAMGPETPELRHEQRDVDIWAVSKFAIGLVVLCIATLAIVVGVFQVFMSKEGRVKQVDPEAVVRRLPNEPLLQDKPVQDLKQMREVEDQILGSYGWVDRQKGIVRLPISRAIDVLAQRGLPSRQANGPQSAAAGVSEPTESGLGEKGAPLSAGASGLRP